MEDPHEEMPSADALPAPAAAPAIGSAAREAELRRQRSAEALRNNLKRRKAQAKSRRVGGTPAPDGTLAPDQDLQHQDLQHQDLQHGNPFEPDQNARTGKDLEPVDAPG